MNIRFFHFDFFSSIAIKKSKHGVHKSGSKKNNGNFEPVSISTYPQDFIFCPGSYFRRG